MISQVLKAADMTIAVFWVVTPCNLVKNLQTSETSINFYQTTRRKKTRRQPSSFPTVLYGKETLILTNRNESNDK
jgi:hypothetical protein